MKQNGGMLMVVRAYVLLLNPSPSMRLPKKIKYPEDWSKTARKLRKGYLILLN